MAHAPAHPPSPAALSGSVPHYGGAAVVEGSLIFLLSIALVATVAYVKRRR